MNGKRMRQIWKNDWVIYKGKKINLILVEGALIALESVTYSTIAPHYGTFFTSGLQKPV